MSEIVKVQLPFFSTDPGAGALIYDQRRKHMVEQEIPQKVRWLIRRRDMPKIYIRASWDAGSKHWIFDNPPVPAVDQTW